MFTLVRSPLSLRNALHCSPLRLACHPGARLHSQPPVGRQFFATQNPASPHSGAASSEKAQTYAG